MYTCGWKIASVPGLPHFDLLFTFTIIHGIGRSIKNFFAGLPLLCIIIHVNTTEGKNGEDLGTRVGGGGMHITKKILLIL